MLISLWIPAYAGMTDFLRVRQLFNNNIDQLSWNINLFDYILIPYKMLDLFVIQGKFLDILV